MEKKIRIVEVVGRMDRAGQEAFLMNVLRAADLNKYEIWFSVNTDYIGEFEQEILSIGGHIYHNPYPASMKNLGKYLEAFRAFLRQEGPFDVVHCHVFYFSAFLLKAAYKENVPIRVMHSHNTSDGFKDTFIRKIYRKLSLSMIKKYSTEKVACGVDAYEYFFREKCPGESKILNNSILLDDFNSESQNIVNLKRELGLPTNKKIIISVARFLPVKNHKKILQVFSEYLALYGDAELVCAGDGPLLMDMQKVAADLRIENNVHFLGVRSDVNRLLMCSDLFIMPSLHEGLPVSLVEAQAAGVPCVISDTITRGIDMGLNMVTWVPLDSDNNRWATECFRTMQKEVPNYSERKKGIEKNGYSLVNTWKKLGVIYNA